MKQSIQTVDAYYEIGCGRCSLAATPACKVRRFPEELAFLRDLLLNSGLKEELKWSMPCFTWNGKNILILGAFKAYCSLNFFNGALLTDPENLLVKAGENSWLGRQMRFQTCGEIRIQEEAIKDFIEQAIKLEKSGKPITKPESPVIKWPEELQEAFNSDAEMERSFLSLSPGRQRSYLLHFSSAKQSATRKSRIQRCRAGIISGKGFNEYP